MSMPAATDSSAGNANLRIGVLAMPQEPIPKSHWHSRNYLPHYEDVAVIQHVTFHLADSLPEKAIQRLKLELESLPKERRDSEHRRQVEAWIDVGHGSCLLRASAVAFRDAVEYIHQNPVKARLVARPEEWAWGSARLMGKNANAEIGVPGTGQNRTHRGEWR